MTGAIVRGQIIAESGLIGGDDGWGIYPLMIANANRHTGYIGSNNYLTKNEG